MPINNTYLLFLLLQQRYSVRQQLHVFFCTFASDLSCYQFAMQRLIIVVLVNVEVHFLELLRILGPVRTAQSVLPLTFVGTLGVSQRLVVVRPIGFRVALVLQHTD